MPLYEYQCDVCGHRFEVIQKFSDPLVEKCPSCGAMVHKLQSAPAIQFKGAGFYITDYAKKEYTADTKADSASADTAGSNEKTDKTEKTEQTEKSVNTPKSDTTDKSASAGGSTPASSSPASTSSSSTKNS